MGLTLITPAAAWPVTLAEVKTYCAAEDGSFDGLLGDLIKSACQRIEQLTGLVLGEQVWKLTLDEFSATIELPRAPVLAVSAVNYVDALGAAQLASASLYSLDLTSKTQWVVLNSGTSWPATRDAVNAVSVTFSAGYLAATLPDDIKLAVKALVVTWFENRGDAGTPKGVIELLFHRMNFGF